MMVVDKKIKTEMIEEARRQNGEVLPSGKHTSVYDCFTVYDKQLLFWFNTQDRTTKVLSKLMEDGHGE